VAVNCCEVPVAMEAVDGVTPSEISTLLKSMDTAA
jgi:hypothetical protein